MRQPRLALLPLVSLLSASCGTDVSQPDASTVDAPPSASCLEADNHSDLEWLEAEVFVGSQALVSRSLLGRRVVVEPAAVVIGVRIAAGRYVPAGVVVNQQSVADHLPEITPSYPLRHRARAVATQSRQRTEAYQRLLD